MSNRARRIKRIHGLDMIIVDYIQLMRGTSNYKDGRVQEVSEITQGLKAIAKELSIPVVALSQLSRQVEQRDNKKPQLTDHYFTGDYPVKPIDELGDSKTTQLSLLNTASNN